MTENSVIDKVLIDLEANFDRILCEFSFDNQDCLVIELPEDTDISICDCHTVVEICRFEVHNRGYAIVTKPSKQKTDELNLTTLLSARELQIATLVALGCPNKQVADKLHISEWTVATYLRRVFAKLGVDTRAAMTYRCATLICRQDVMTK